MFYCLFKASDDRRGGSGLPGGGGIMAAETASRFKKYLQ